jgi:hypothetical protein
MTSAIIVAFYSPADFVLPRLHLRNTLERLLHTGRRVICGQVVRPGQEAQPVPAGVELVVRESDDAIFFKENVWNLVAERADATRLVFVDADVEFTNPYWIEQAEMLLRDCPIIQPYSEAVWLARDGGVELTRPSAAAAMMHGHTPHPGTTHPGFAWAMTRAAWSRIGGWYELHPSGGGDTAFALALAGLEAADRWAAQVGREAAFVGRQSFRRWASLVAGLAPRVGAVLGKCRHAWHGDRRRRRYIGRDQWMPQVGADELPLARREDGVLAWTDAAANDLAREYFLQRAEDG